ncbi:hypothetical protein M569_13424 [Genlisea aurea]|uniref:Uncharacterized protein n=1 Tax=Genlisea aurea TaxID=192259 RepID=S8C404_9LAMI|nr:hypothetical protein M569_13424 [Genlisea aurea]
MHPRQRIRLAQEKNELIQSLSAESSRSSKLLESNRELSRKLELQTQRLELLTSQSLTTADNNILQHKQPENHHRGGYENKPLAAAAAVAVYADEGDEAGGGEGAGVDHKAVPGRGFRETE